MKIALILLAAFVAGIAANVVDPISSVKKLEDLDQEVEDFILEDDDDEEEEDFDEDEDEEQSPFVRSLAFLKGRNAVCAGKAKGGCTKKGGSCVTEPFADNCKALHGDVGKLKKQGCLSKDCQCCVPPPTCSGKIKNSCSKKGGYCVLKPFKSNCKGGELNKKACKSKFCQCCIPGKTGGSGSKETTPAKPATTLPPVTGRPAPPTTLPPTTPPPPPPTTLPPAPPTTIPAAPPTTTPPPPPTTLPPAPPTTLPPAPPTTTPPPPPTTLPPAPPTTLPPAPPTTTPPPPPTTLPPAPPTTLPPAPPTTTPPPPPTTLPPAPTTQAVPEGKLLPSIIIRDEHIQWKQGSFFGMGGSRKQDYTLVLTRGPGQEEEFVYIQHGYPKDALINECDLQYGSYEIESGRTGVFFVYHDKSQKPYQKRFGLKANGLDQGILDAIGEGTDSSTFPGTSSSSNFWNFNWLSGDNLKDVDC